MLLPSFSYEKPIPTVHYSTYRKSQILREDVALNFLKYLFRYCFLLMLATFRKLRLHLTTEL